MPPAQRTVARISTGPSGPGSPGARNAPQDVETARRTDAAMHAPCDGPPPVPISGAGGHHGAPARLRARLRRTMNGKTTAHVGRDGLLLADTPPPPPPSWPIVCRPQWAAIVSNKHHPKDRASRWDRDQALIDAPCFDFRRTRTPVVA